MRQLVATVALAVFLLGTLTSESILARGGGRGGGSHGAGFHAGGSHGGGFHGGGHRRGSFHSGARHDHGAKHFHHGHGRVRVLVGAPVIFGSWAYASSDYYFPFAPSYSSAPYFAPTYIEQGDGQRVPPTYWYYCRDVNAYYPYVKECPGGWVPVVPHAPPP